MNSRAKALALLALPLLAVPALPVQVLAATSGPCAAPTISGTDRDDVLAGTAGPDVIDGRGGDDEIEGLAGDDVLCGGEGTDRLDGGEGSDRLYGGTDGKVLVDTASYEFYGDTLAGGPGDDLLDVGADEREEGSHDVLSFRGSPTGVVLDLPAGTAVGEGTDLVVGEVDRVLGTDHDDVLLGTDEDQELFGYRGSDHIDGGGGDDVIEGGSTYEDAADEDLSETTGNVLLGGPGDDQVGGSDGDDVVRGGPGHDSIGGDGGLDQLRGGTGRDTVSDTAVPGDGQVASGGPGSDDLDLYFGETGPRLLPGAVVRLDMTAGTARARAGTVRIRLSVPGFEWVQATHGKAWFVRGTDGPDGIYTTDRVRLVARGLAGDDRFDGSVRADVLDGGPGIDRTYGPPGPGDRHISIEDTIS